MVRSFTEYVTAYELKDMLEYNPMTGIFIWKNSNRASINGYEAGCPTTGGYITITIDGQTYPAHRLAFLYMTDRWPVEFVDHINMNTSDNRWENLREASRSQNSAHSPRESKGVRRRSSGRWEARIRVDKKEIYLGSFNYKWEADKVFAEACDKYRGDFSTP